MSGILGYSREISGLVKNLDATGKNGGAIGIGKAVDTFIKSVRSCERTGGKVIFIGNGGSASIAGHQAIDFWKNGGIKAVSFNEPSLLTCLANDFGYERVFQKPVEMFAEKRDVLVAISSSGRSKNILNAVKKAGEKGCKVVTLSGFDGGNPLRKLGELNFFVSSKKYGPVEIAHLMLCHYILDSIMELKK